MDAEQGAILADDVAKRYGDVTALDGVSLSVDRGEVLALIGPNGAGKTTLVKCLTGTTTPSDGEVAVLDAPPTASDRSRVGVLPQEFRPQERLTAREIVEYYAGLYADARTPEGVLDDVALEEGARGQRYRALSGGQQRRVCVAASLVNDPDALFLDEPTTGIDPAGRRALWGLVVEAAADDTAVLLTTHDMAEAERLGDRVALIDDGSLVATGAADEVVARHGGEPTLIVEPHEPDAVDDGTLQAVDATRRDGAIRVEGVTSAEITTVLDRLEDAGVGYDAVTWRQPTLEDVFLALTEDDGDA